MNKLKGSMSAVKMKYLIFVFAAAMLAILPTRVYQLLAIVDYTNGFYNGSDITVPVLYGAIFIFALIFMALSFVSKEVPSPKLPAGKNPVLGISSLIMVAGLGWDILSIERKVIPQVQGGFSFEMFKSLMNSNLEQNGGVFLVLEFVFAIFAIFYFLIFAVSHLNGKASYKEYKLLALSPLCWAITMLVSRLMTAVSFVKVSELLFEIFMLVFAMLFFLTFARISSAVFTEDSMWGIYGYGFSAALFAGLVTIPRLACSIIGLPYVEGYEFNFAHLAILIFVLSYVVASLGVGFKDGIKNIRAMAQIQLPDDESVVVKHGKTPVVEEVFEAAEPEYEFFEEAEVEAEEAVEEQEEIAEDVIEEPLKETEELTEEPADEIEEEAEEILEESAEESIAEDESAETPAEELIAEDEPAETPAEEPIAEDEPAETPAEEPKKDKKDKKSLFGLRKAPVAEETIAEDLKPISLADMKKKQ